MKTSMVPGFALVLRALNASRGAGADAGPGGLPEPFLKLHITADRQTTTMPAALQELPPIYLNRESAASLPVAILAAIDRYLPEASQAAREQLVQALSPAASRPSGGANH